MKTKRLFILLAAIKNAYPYAVIASELKDTTQLDVCLRTIQRNLADLHDTGLVYSTIRSTSNEYYWALTDAGKAYFGLPVEKEQAA